MRFDARTGRRLGPRRLISDDVGPAPALAGLLPGGRLVTSSVADDTVISDATTLRPVRRFAAGGAPATVSPDGHLAALALPTGSVRLLDLRTGRAQEFAEGHGASTTALRFTPDSRKLVAAGGDAPITVWDVRRAARVDTFRGHVGAVEQLAIARDGRTAYSAGFDGNVIAWDLAEDRTLGRPFRLAPGLSSDVLAVGAGGSTFAVPSRGGDVDLLDSRNPSRARRIRVGAVQPATGRTAPIAIAPYGRTLAASIGEGAVRFVDLATGRPLGAPSRASAGIVQVLAFSRDGHWLATSGDDQVIYLWDVSSGRPIGTALPGVAGHPVSAAFLNRGRLLVTLHDNGRGSIWDVQPGSWARRACLIAGRTLTRTELQDTLPKRDYAPACARP